MKHQEEFFECTAGANICCQAWLPEETPRAILLLVHGLAEHCGRYTNVVDHFVPLGYGVYGLDHLGHGRSEGTRVYVDRFADFTDTLHTYVGMIKRSHPETPIFMVGHSMGGLISAVYLLDHQDELAGAVLSAPGVKVPDGISPLTLIAGRVLSALAPKAGLLALDPQGVSRDPEIVRAYVEDPLVYTGKSTARLAAEMLKAMQRVTAEASQITLPTLIMQGTGDKMVDPGGAQMLYDSIRSADKTLNTYPGLYHEIFNEPERAQVLGDLEAWLQSHSPGLEAH